MRRLGVVLLWIEAIAAIGATVSTIGAFLAGEVGPAILCGASATSLTMSFIATRLSLKALKMLEPFT